MTKEDKPTKTKSSELGAKDLDKIAGGNDVSSDVIYDDTIQDKSEVGTLLEGAAVGPEVSPIQEAVTNSTIGSRTQALSKPSELDIKDLDKVAGGSSSPR